MISFYPQKPKTGRYIITGKPEYVALADTLIEKYVYAHRKITGVQNYQHFELLPFSKLKMNNAETIHCINEDALTLRKYMYQDSNALNYENKSYKLDKLEENIRLSNNDTFSDNFIDEYSTTIKKVKNKAKKELNIIENIFPDNKAIKRLNAKRVLIAIKDNKFDFKTGTIKKHKNLRFALSDKTCMRNGVMTFLSEHTDTVNPDKYLDYYINTKGALKKRNVWGRKIQDFLWQIKFRFFLRP